VEDFHCPSVVGAVAGKARDPHPFVTPTPCRKLGRALTAPGSWQERVPPAGQGNLFAQIGVGNEADVAKKEKAMPQCTCSPAAKIA
jgi:hypothetical protein